MAEPTQFAFTYKDIVGMLVREAGVTEGEWGLQLQFGLNAMNAGPDDNKFVPSALVGVVAIGIQKADKPTNLTVNASEIAAKAKAKAKP